MTSSQLQDNLKIDSEEIAENFEEVSYSRSQDSVKTGNPESFKFLEDVEVSERSSLGADPSILSQAKSLSEAYERPLLQPISNANISANAIPSDQPWVKADDSSNYFDT